jgi:hypothetical protein
MMRKRKHWRVGPVEFDLVTQVERREVDDPAALSARPELGDLQAGHLPEKSSRVFLKLEGQTGNQVVFSHSFRRLLLLAPAAGVLAWWNWWGISTLWWVALFAAIVPTALFLHGLRPRWDDS